jgi:hypothetical protein
MSQDEFTKLYKYLQQEFAAVRKEISYVDDKVNHVYSAVDAILKNQEIYEHEQLAIKRQLARHEK